MKYVVVSGGVMSGLGKGISSSSIGLLLKASGLNVTSIKIDPYLNTDAGTMSPFEHGEVYVLDDGGEVDLDLGNYERFLGTTLTKDHNITTGKVYQKVINAERQGEYLGKTVQVIPHITDAIQDWIERVAVIPVDGTTNTPDICLIELGGTVGDIESMVFLEALRQFEYRVGSDNLCHVHVSLVPAVGSDGEPKSKPTQHAVRELRAAGFPPNFIFCRSTNPLDRGIIKKISQFCMVPHNHVISVHDVSNIMRVPVLLLEQDVPALILSTLRMNRMAVEDIPSWRTLAEKIDTCQRTVRIAMVGKYTHMSDAYLSVTKSLFYAGIHSNVKVKIDWIEASDLEEATKHSNVTSFDTAWQRLRSCEGILIPGGFGNRGVEGMILAAHYARNKNIPYFGICLGMQVAVIEYCRSKLGLIDANSAEFDPSSSNQVIEYMPEHNPGNLGGTMRLGARGTTISRGSMAHFLYGSTHVVERHRHRYEVSGKYISKIQEAGGRFTGVDDSRQRMEIFEIEGDHPFYVGAQFHPEFLSRPLAPSPLFLGFVLAASRQLEFGVRHPVLPVFKNKTPFASIPKGDALTEAVLENDEVETHANNITPMTTPRLFLPGSPLLTVSKEGEDLGKLTIAE